MSQDAYQKRVAHERQHFENIASFSALPKMTDWWSQRWLRPRVRDIFGTGTPTEFYATPIIQKAATNGHVRVLSLGSGDGETETAIAEFLHAKKVGHVSIVGIDLSPELVKRANAAAAAAKMSETVHFIADDLNAQPKKDRYDIVIANQVLHHIVNLEELFCTIHQLLADDGFFLTRDMVGRNGHQAWPEAKRVVDNIWAAMPAKYKYRHGGGEAQLVEAFPNTDFSHSSFEGVRAQDVLPLLVQSFGFRRFYAFGGIVERFVNRRWGPNYDTADPHDRLFVTNLQVINDLAIDGGIVKPTQIVAWMQKAPCDPICWGARTPNFCVRPVEWES